MPGTGSYPGGGSASADYFFTAGELLAQLPDNTANMIVAKDIRDSVWTLWNRIDDVQIIASQSASASSYFQNSAQTPTTIGGIPAGSSFSTPKTMQEMFDLLLYPYIAPSCSLSGGTNRELGSTNSVSLSWSVIKNSNPITSIIVNGTPILPTGGNQTGVQAAVATQNVTTTFTMTVSDGTSTPSSNTSVTWSNRRYWGTHPTFTLPNNAQILALSGAGVGTGNELSATRVQTRNGINGGGNYLVFAWPTSFGTPTFIINGLPNSAWTKIGNAISFTNVYSYTNNYDVWISNTAQNSPITLFQIN